MNKGSPTVDGAITTNPTRDCYLLIDRSRHHCCHSVERMTGLQVEFPIDPTYRHIGQPGAMAV
jgi:hypothetical protein